MVKTLVGAAEPDDPDGSRRVNPWEVVPRSSRVVDGDRASLSIAEAASLLGVSDFTMREIIRSRVLDGAEQQPQEIGGRWIVPRAMVDRLLASVDFKEFDRRSPDQHLEQQRMDLHHIRVEVALQEVRLSSVRREAELKAMEIESLNATLATLRTQIAQLPTTAIVTPPPAPHRCRWWRPRRA